jgi:hypothetical protein
MSGTIVFHIVFAAFVVVFLSTVWLALLLETRSQPPAAGPDANSGREATTPPASTDARPPVRRREDSQQAS